MGKFHLRHGFVFLCTVASVLTSVNSMIIKQTTNVTKVIKNEPKTWICNNQTINHPEIIENVMRMCVSRPGLCKILCAYKELGFITSDYGLDQLKVKEHFRQIIPVTKDADDISSRFMLCDSSLKTDENDLECIANQKFFDCACHSIIKVCNLPEGSFGFKDI